jgi:hypothetical protein
MALKRFFSLLPLPLSRLFRSSSPTRAVSVQIIGCVNYVYGEGRLAADEAVEKDQGTVLSSFPFSRRLTSNPFSPFYSYMGSCFSRTLTRAQPLAAV